LSAAFTNGLLADFLFGGAAVQFLLGEFYNDEYAGAKGCYRYGARFSGDLGFAKAAVQAKFTRAPGYVYGIADESVDFITPGVYFDFNSALNFGFTLGYTGFAATEIFFQGNVSYAKGSDDDAFDTLPSDDASWLSIYAGFGATVALSNEVTLLPEIVVNHYTYDRAAVGYYGSYTTSVALALGLQKDLSDTASVTAGFQAGYLTGGYLDGDGDILSSTEESVIIFAVPIGLKMRF
jgi:hypothetical protein